MMTDVTSTRRIFGLETEYGVTCATTGDDRLTADEVARHLFRKVVAWGRSSNVFLTNGSRLYLDVGSHPEYATAECDDLRQLVTYDRGGERILEGLVEDAQQRLTEEGGSGTIHLFKNNTDSAGNSYGCHENYLVRRKGDFAKLSDLLVPFLITRQVLTGAGKIHQTPQGARFCLSQRAEHIWEAVSSATTRSRPIINTRDEPHAEHQQCHALGRRHIHQRCAPQLAKHHPVQGAQAGGPVPAGGGAARLIEARKNRQIAGQMHGAQRRAVKGRQGAVGPGFRRQLCGNFCRFRGGVHG